MDALVRRRALVTGASWMTVLGTVLFFLPALGALIAGLVGGYLMGGARRALAAAVLPAVLLALIWSVLLVVVTLPLVGPLHAVGVLSWVVVSEVALLVGAGLGGLSRPHGPAAPVQRGFMTSASGTA
jgi:hypothetical protein